MDTKLKRLLKKKYNLNDEEVSEYLSELEEKEQEKEEGKPEEKEKEEPKEEPKEEKKEAKDEDKSKEKESEGEEEEDPYKEAILSLSKKFDEQFGKLQEDINKVKGFGEESKAGKVKKKQESPQTPEQIFAKFK